MASYKVEGVILKRNNFGEADRILTVFSQKYGKLSVLAKGVRRITSRRAGAVELFNQTSLYLHRGRTFDLLTEASCINDFSFFRRDLSKVGVAYYGAELVDRLTAEGQEHDDVYDLLVKLLGWLDGLTDNTSLDSGLERFEKSLLTKLGFWSSEMEGTVDTKLYLEELIGGRIRSAEFLHIDGL